MRQLLEAPGDAPPIEVVELARVEKTAGPFPLPGCANCISSATGGDCAAGAAGNPLFLMQLAESEHQTA
jgi:[citrate (pro-3S)-lyase] ligase